MSIDFDFDAEADEFAFEQAEAAFEAFMAEQSDNLISAEEDQARYEEWCEGQGLSAAEDNWEAYFDSLIPGDEW